MAIGYFLVPMGQRPGPHARTVNGIRHENMVRYCRIRDARDLIHAEGGAYHWIEILGNQAIAKVRASEALLTTIGAVPGVRRIPISRLDDPLSDQPAGVRNAIRQEILDAGYTVQEVNTRFPNIANHTLREVLEFMASRRLQPRAVLDENGVTVDIPVDGDPRPCSPISDLQHHVPD